ncbi:EamA/RhaT family transporter [Streptomyces sp. CRN 30]|uniref:EamA/RhaT family transporter n=1 Tax=Streptomyces sp. CRN 30 TaxID=3075613 RepID=UPI002A7F4646|nr:EamA/RhaT family transporter [Streptomyces sp. CRN 30]
MSDERHGNGTPARPAGPRPEPIRFFGTTWLHHDGGYRVRRVAVPAGALLTVAAACLVLRLAHEGLRLGALGGFVPLLVVVVFAVCSALAFGHTWGGYRERPDPDRRAALRGLLTVGFLGSLLAYFLRSLTEAPGEKLHREEYEQARARYERRTTRRAGNPSRRRS